MRNTKTYKWFDGEVTIDFDTGKIRERRNWTSYAFNYPKEKEMTKLLSFAYAEYRIDDLEQLRKHPDWYMYGRIYASELDLTRDQVIHIITNT